MYKSLGLLVMLTIVPGIIAYLLSTIVTSPENLQTVFNVISNMKIGVAVMFVLIVGTTLYKDKI